MDKVYEQLRVAEGRVSFDDLGLGLYSEDREGEGEEGEEMEGISSLKDGFLKPNAND